MNPHKALNRFERESNYNWVQVTFLLFVKTHLCKTHRQPDGSYNDDEGDREYHTNFLVLIMLGTPYLFLLLYRN